MDPAVGLIALSFQALLTLLQALVYLGLWRQQPHAYFLAWAAAWTMYAVRLACISAYLMTRDEVWLFAHQTATGLTALLLLWAALQYARGHAWRWRYALFGLVPAAWAWIAIYVLHDMRTAGLSSAIMLSAVTLVTGTIFWRRRRALSSPGGDASRSVGSTILAWTFTLWGLHHLDYPLLRPLGNGLLYGVFADVLFIVAAAIGTLFLVLGEGRRVLEERTAHLEQLTRQLLRAQEDERRRIARELHDQAGQVLTAVKIELDLDGRAHASEMVGKALAQVRDLSNLLRPTVLDDLGLLPALRGLIEDFSKSTRIEAGLRTGNSLPRFSPETEVVLYRVVQEGLTNVARHAEASHVQVTLDATDGAVRIAIQDDGKGSKGQPAPRLGLDGIRERITALGGTLSLVGAPGSGFRLEVAIPMERA